MSHSFSEEKPPRKPVEYGNLVICKEDFEEYKKFLEHKPDKYTKAATQSLLREFNVDNAFLKFHKMSSDRLKELIKNGKEDIAFKQFIQSFPSCLPNRTYLRTLFDSFQKF